MHVMNHNWSATKQSVAEISRHSVLSGDRIRQCVTMGLATRTQISVCKSPFPSAGTAVSLFSAKTVQQRPLLPREVETQLPDCGVAHLVRVDHLSRLSVMPPSNFMSAGCKSSLSGLLDVSRSNGGLRISGWICQLSCFSFTFRDNYGSILYHF